ncbi:MAG: DUF5060 domain-containing protein [Bacteroidales bacterium]|nr:DUF5060 domain-containing protein [Bacteroidales bacterium]
MINKRFLRWSGFILMLLCIQGCKPGGTVLISGELKQWHNVILTLEGPFANEGDTDPNPFTDYRMDVIFTHESGDPSYTVPGYFAADGNAAETSAESGDRWRAHLAPDKTGNWDYKVSFRLKDEPTEWDGISGSFQIGPGDKAGPDLRAKGRLQYVGERYLRFAGTGEYFLKAGADAPETLLAYEDFDGSYAAKEAGVKRQGEAVTTGLKSWGPHIGDWQTGDPTWKDGKGKGMIGAINYLSGKECNVFSFLTYNAGGDGDNVWPHISREDKYHFDCSKLDQWGIVFNHATTRGMYLHFKLQETENDDLNHRNEASTQQALDGGDLGPERKLYLRELIARYGHNLALNWNLGEENTQSTRQIRDMAGFIRQTDPYGHIIVLHTYPNRHDSVYGPLLGDPEVLTGLSIQNSDVSTTHAEAVRWVTRSEESGHPWVVAHDEAGNAATGTPADPGYPGMKEAVAALELDEDSPKLPTIDEIRGEVLWGNLMGGGAGVEYYFGYQLPENDLGAQDWRSRELTWDYSRFALAFFHDHEIPFWEMINADALVGNKLHDNSVYCFAKPGKIYVVYLPAAGSARLDLTGVEGKFKVKWYNPRTGSELLNGSIAEVQGGATVDLGVPPADLEKDWVALLK